MNRSETSVCLWTVVALVAMGVANTANASLVRYFGMNETDNPSEGAAMVDSSPLLLNGTYHGSPTLGVASANAGLFGTAVNFSAANADYADLGTDGSVANLRAPVTYAAWIKPTANEPAFATIVGRSQANSANGAAFGVTDGKLAFVGHDGTNYSDADVITSADYGQWVHVAITVSGTPTTACPMTFYKNGNVVGTVADGWVGQVYGSPVNYLVGGGRTDENWDGGIDEVRIYDEALSTEAVQQLVTGVPEPSTLVLAISGLIGLLAYAWKRQK